MCCCLQTFLLIIIFQDETHPFEMQIELPWTLGGTRFELVKGSTNSLISEGPE
jgi:hypothetical protein